MDLQTAFYTIGIIFMVLMFILFVVLLAAILTIKAKINHFHAMYTEKANQMKAVKRKLTIGANFLKLFVFK